MIQSEHMNLREVADQLGIESWRMARLGRYLGLDALKKQIPARDVKAMAMFASPEDRFAAARRWLLDHLHTPATDPGVPPAVRDASAASHPGASPPAVDR